MQYYHFDAITSTNTYLQEQLMLGSDIDGWVVSADEQSNGKGMGSNQWHSEPSKNLLFSMAFRLDFLEAGEQFLISQAVTLGILHILDKYLSYNMLCVKWPNDIYYGDKKMGGMLVVNTIAGSMMDMSIIGVGLNVNQTHFPAALPNPISMALVTGEIYELKALLMALTEQVRSNIYALKDVEYRDILRREYLKRLFRYQKIARYCVDGREVSLYMEGVDGFGRLLLRDKNGVTTPYDIKEVSFVF